MRAKDLGEIANVLGRSLRFASPHERDGLIVAWDEMVAHVRHRYPEIDTDRADQLWDRAHQGHAFEPEGARAAAENVWDQARQGSEDPCANPRSTTSKAEEKNMTHPTSLAANVTLVAEWLAEMQIINIASIHAFSYLPHGDVEVGLYSAEDVLKIGALGHDTGITPFAIYVDFAVRGLQVHAYAARTSDKTHPDPIASEA